VWGNDALRLKGPPMFWFGVYLGVATLATVAIFVAADWYRQEHIAAPDHSGLMSAVAGILFPVLLVAVTELALISFVARRHRLDRRL